MQLSTTAVAVYFYLLHISNRTGWNGSVALSDAKIMADLGINRTALANARITLTDAGIIALRNRGNGRGKTVYDIIRSMKKNNCTFHADSSPNHNTAETAQNMQITPQDNCTFHALKNVKNCTDNCTKRADSHLINNILSTSNEVSDIFNKTKNIVDSEYKYSSSTTSLTVDDVAKKFFEEISDAHFVRHAVLALAITKEQYLSLARAVIAEWQLSEPANFLPENSPKKHLINQVRIKRDHPGELRAQAAARTAEVRRQERQARAEQEQRESTEPRGQEALKIYRASKGMKPDENILSVLSPRKQSEEDAIRDARSLIAPETSNH